MIENAGAQQSVDDSPFITQEVNTVCDIAESTPERFGAQGKTVRDICRARRQALADRGQRAVPPKPTSQGGPGRNGYQIDGYLDTALHGREAAKRHREMLCHYGRGTSPSCRPTGRVKKNGQAETETIAPKKVETGHTLSGGLVTGTQVERKDRVTGNEPGSCRAVTGTEYVGSEQFQSFCKTKPEANPVKVQVTSTARGHKVSGTEVARTEKLTGGEAGTCRNVTGTEYLSNEAHLSLCGTAARPMNAEKVMIGATARTHQMITGSDEFRPSGVTGNESGSGRTITGSQYADEGVARLTINGAPAKVPTTHTFAGNDVTGTEVGRSVKVTGDERGSCRQISGTEYLSNEQFQSYCGTKPERGPVKVGLDRSDRGQQITGNLVDRTEKVTGNEPGSCNRVTGSQYGKSSLCGGGVDKVRSMRTLTGNAVTGQQLDHGPKMSGDERGGCMPVTGDEYYGVEHFEPFCTSTPEPQPQKVEQSMTCHGQVVSGTSVDASDIVTGNEFGAHRPISGTPYQGAQQTGCIQPSAMNGAMGAARQVSNRYVRFANPELANPAPVEEAPVDFSITTPARAAQRRITGSAMDHSRRITGPGMLANGLITGTPEFRHGDNQARGFAQPMAMAMAQRPAPAPIEMAPTPVVAEPAQEPAPVAEGLACAPRSAGTERVTGEGKDRCRITGDDWSVNDHITGTAGQWASARNPSMRGNARGAVVNARNNRDVARPEAPGSRITGSSGNDTSGSLITYSGGARG
ncbi:hypothetical protein A9404_06285 [Halothiobacillus diazotrophicus]|uniref:Carboxysome shell protein n=2 Tax=Halothiobacillus diazotrophicus TaxID=1860122 RepID=A0A191ZKE9_9GAMM|nr:hypothetical protein A9404_06285 [Halothiobacillus diazotrophicus]